MDKKQFHDLLIPLTEQEKFYQIHPEEADRGFRNLSQLREDGVYEVRIQGEGASHTHGMIWEGQAKQSPYQNIVFNKQTRFSRVPLHRHNYLEMFYIYAGQCGAVINGRRVELQTGDVCIMDVRAIHAIDPLEEKDIVLNCMISQSYFNIQFIGRLAASGPVAQFLAGALSEHTGHDNYLLFHTAGEPMVKELFENAFCEYLDPGICSADTLDSYMTLIFIQLARCYQKNKEQEYRADSRSYLTEILHYIEKNYANCTLEQAAVQFNFHPNYLSRAIKKATGFSFKELVDQTRLRQAAFLLQNTSMPVSEIAQECGWSNQNQFYKKFMAGYGCTPRQYREQEGKP